MFDLDVPDKPDKVIVALFDFHSETKFIPLIQDFLAYIKPTHLVIGGDIGNFDAVSSFKGSRQIALLEGKTVEWEVDHINDNIVTPLYMSLPETTEWIWLEGNHDYRLNQYLAEDPTFGDYYKFKNCVARWMAYTPYQFFEINKPWRPVKNLQYLHGIYWNLHHAAKTIIALHRTTIYGHVHDSQKDMAVSPIDQTEFMYAKSIGCLCNRNPDYMRNKPNRWSHGLSITYTWKDGRFNEYDIHIVDGQFYYPNQLFSL